MNAGCLFLILGVRRERYATRFKPLTTYELPTCRLHDNPKLLMIVCVCAVDKTPSLPRVPSITVDGAPGLDLQIFY